MSDQAPIVRYTCEPALLLAATPCLGAAELAIAERWVSRIQTPTGADVGTCKKTDVVLIS